MLIFIPLVNVFAILICLALPTDFAKNKSLDTAGKIIVVIERLFFGLFLYGLGIEANS